MWIANIIRYIVEVWNGFTAELIRILSVTPRGWSSEAWTLTESINKGVMSFAVTLMVLFWSISFFKYVDDIHRLTGREVIGWIARFAIGYAIVVGSMFVMEAVLAGATKINIIVLDNISFTAESAAVPDSLQQAIDSINLGMLESGEINIFNMGQQLFAFIQALPLSIFLFVVLLVTIGCGLTCIIVVWIRFFKLYIYCAIAPIPLATLGGSGTTEIGKQFLKAWAAVCIEVVVISLALALFNAVMAGVDSLKPFNIFQSAADADANTILWNETMNWIVMMLIRIVGMTAIVKTAEKIAGSICGR